MELLQRDSPLFIKGDYDEDWCPVVTSQAQNTQQQACFQQQHRSWLGLTMELLQRDSLLFIKKDYDEDW